MIANEPEGEYFGEVLKNFIISHYCCVREGDILLTYYYMKSNRWRADFINGSPDKGLVQTIVCL